MLHTANGVEYCMVHCTAKPRVQPVVSILITTKIQSILLNDYNHPTHAMSRCLSHACRLRVALPVACAACRAARRPRCMSHAPIVLLVARAPVALLVARPACHAARRPCCPSPMLPVSACRVRHLPCCLSCEPVASPVSKCASV